VLAWIPGRVRGDVNCDQASAPFQPSGLPWWLFGQSPDLVSCMTLAPAARVDIGPQLSVQGMGEGASRVARITAQGVVPWGSFVALQAWSMSDAASPQLLYAATIRPALDGSVTPVLDVPVGADPVRICVLADVTTDAQFGPSPPATCGGTGSTSNWASLTLPSSVPASASPKASPAG
jgi:hypothetical protein